MGDVAEWRRQRQEWVNASWAPYLEGSDSDDEESSNSEAEALNLDCVRSGQPVSATAEARTGQDRENPSADGSDHAPVKGELRPWVAEGERVMVCIGFEVVPTRHGKKVYLYWREKKGSPSLVQFFPHYENYPVASKAVENYIVAMGHRPERLDRLSFRRLIGLKARVYIETVRPTYSTGALKGREKPEATHYSKVSEILGPLGHVDADSLRELRGKGL